MARYSERAAAFFLDFRVAFSEEQKMRKKRETHGDARTRLYAIYCGMKSRCYDEGWALFKYYGARGVRVCDEWRDSYLSFRAWALSNGYQDGLTLDRIDCGCGYGPSNCRWVPKEDQSRNRTCCTTYNGVCLAEYCRQNGISYDMVITRRLRGWDLREAVETPKGSRRSRAACMTSTAVQPRNNK